MRNLASIGCLAVFVVLAACVPWARAEGEESAAATPPAPPSAEQLIGQLKRGHPRLLVDEAAFAALKKRIEDDATLQEWDKELRRRADGMIDAPLPRHVLPDGKRLLSTSRSVVEHVYTLALTYRLHGDRRYLDRVWREAETVAAFEDFNPRHFLDTAEMTHGLAIAYDWLYDAWSEPQRKTIREAIVRLGLEPGLEVYRRPGGWHRSIHNWNQVCNGGMALGALAVGDEEPQLAGEILHAALVSVPLAMHSYAPDGAWGEGPGYWSYATSYNVLMLAGLRSALGSDFGLAEMPGFAETGLFPLYMTGPSGRLFNFSDSGDRMHRTDPLFWLSERFGQPVFTWYAVTQGEPSPLAMLWYQKPGQDPIAAGLAPDKYFRHVEVATLRGRWNDPQATFVGIQAGSNRVNHNHLDLGSFVLDALGQRWAVDLGGDDYNLPGYFGGQRYNYYRLRAEGHNTLVLDPREGPDQDPQAEASIRRFVSDAGQAFAVADLTPAYAKSARRVERGVSLVDRRCVLVQDEVDAEKPVDLWWFMHTPAKITLSQDGREAYLKQGGCRLTAQLLAPAKARFTVREAEPLSTSPNPEGQRRNEDVRKLTVHLEQARQVRLAVLFTPEDGKGDGPPELKPLAAW